MNIYWDQTSLLAQIGLVNSKGLPISGIEQAKILVDLATKKGDNKQKEVI